MTILLLILFTLLGIDLFLNMVDPSGIKAYFTDIHTLSFHYRTPDNRGYVLEPGHYDLVHWQANVLEDGMRFVPDTVKAQCVIAFVGDSITFGHGVEDADTFVSQLARDAKGVQYINAGVSGYNAVNVLRAVKATPADGYIYTMIYNDAYAGTETAPLPDLPSTSLLYLQALTNRAIPTEDFTAFDAAIAELKTMDNVVIVAFEGDPLAVRAGVPTISRWTHNVSRFDSHPDRAGHSEIAAQLQGYVDALAVKVC